MNKHYPLVIAGLVAAQSAQAVVFNINGNTADQGIYSTGGSNWVGQDTGRVGGASDTADGAFVYVFALPDLGGEAIDTASLDFSFTISNSPNGNADLYGLDYSSTAGVSAATDYYQGAYGDDPNATPLQDDILTLSSTEGRMSTDATGSANLASYLTAQYDNGAQPGDYVKLRLNIDVANESNYYYYKVDSANNGTVENRPVLNITTVPEPSTFAIGAGVIAILATVIRRKR